MGFYQLLAYFKSLKWIFVETKQLDVALIVTMYHANSWYKSYKSCMHIIWEWIIQ